MQHHEISEHWGQRKDLKASRVKIKIITKDHKTRQCMASITTQICYKTLSDKVFPSCIETTNQTQVKNKQIFRLCLKTCYLLYTIYFEKLWYSTDKRFTIKIKAQTEKQRGDKEFSMSVV